MLCFDFSLWNSCSSDVSLRRIEVNTEEQCPWAVGRSRHGRFGVVFGAETDRELEAIGVIRRDAAAEGLIGVIGEASDLAHVASVIFRSRSVADLRSKGAMTAIKRSGLSHGGPADE